MLEKLQMKSWKIFGRDMQGCKDMDNKSRVVNTRKAPPLKGYISSFTESEIMQVYIHTTRAIYCARKASLGLRQIFLAHYAGCLSVFLPIKLSRLTAKNTERTQLFRFRAPQLPAGWPEKLYIAQPVEQNRFAISLCFYTDYYNL